MGDIRPATDADLDRILQLEAQAFNIPRAENERRRDRYKLEQARVYEDDGIVHGTTRAVPFGHWFGGRLVPGAGISGVAVSAESRGRGIGVAMMTERMRDLRAQGLAISSLYPATVPIYHGVGYGFGGVRTAWKATIGGLPDDRSVRVEPFTDDHLEEVDALYRDIAARTNGLIERTDDWWRNRVLDESDNEPWYRYLVREDGRLTGWIVYRARKSKESWRTTLSARDLFWTTPGSARALLGLASLHRSMSGWIEWIGPPTEVLGGLIREDDHIELENAFRWMLRLLDVPTAFEARGYNPALEAEVTIEVRDPLFDENTGPWQVRVSGGSAKVAPGGEPSARADVQTWASLWSGHIAPADAVRMGALDATDEARAALELMFAGPSPWLADFF